MGSRRRNLRRFVCIPCTVALQDKRGKGSVIVRRIGKHSNHFHDGVIDAAEVK